MSKELRICATIVVPDETFEQAVALAKLKPAIEQVSAVLKEAAGDAAVAVTTDLVATRERKAAQANAATAPAAETQAEAEHEPKHHGRRHAEAA